MKRNTTVREAVRKLKVKGYDLQLMKQDGFSVNAEELRNGITSIFAQAQDFCDTKMWFC